MPRLTPCRLLRGLALPWIVMLGLWFFLPSPTIPADRRGTYIQTALAAGRPVTTVHDWSPSFSKRPGARNMMGESTTLIIQWQLAALRTGANKRDILLRLTDSGDTVNLSGAIREATSLNGFPSSDEKRWSPYRASSKLIDGIAAGDPDEEVNMPWFHHADKAIIHYNMHGFTGEAELDIVVPSTGVVEIWKQAVLQDALDSLPINAEVQSNRTDVSSKSRYSQDTKLPFAQAYKKISSFDRQAGVLATLKLPPKAQLRDVLVERLDGELPSRTLPIRKALMFPLGPLLSIFSGLFMLIPELFGALLPNVFIVFIAYMGVVLVYWVRAGRPHFAEWLSMFWMTRWWAACGCRNKKSKKKDVWGPLGPVDSKGGHQEYDEEKAIGLQRPQTAMRVGRTRKDSYV